MLKELAGVPVARGVVAADDVGITFVTSSPDRRRRLERDPTVAVDPVTHRVFFPTMVGPKGTPVLRIMQPAAQAR